jgi:Fur family transcriptional regulator, ferric uptake regulator
MSCVTTLKQNGLRLTPQRLLIADIIHNVKGHITAQEIIESVRAQMPGVNKSTIYRNLDILEKAGCVFKCEQDNEIIYHHDESHHHHLMCSRCGKTVPCDEGIFSTVRTSVMKRYGFRTDFQHLIVNGICRECQQS